MTNKMTQTEALKKYYNKIYRICLYKTEYNEFQAQNCTQAIFEALIMKWDKIKPECIYSWLLKTTDNKLKEYARQKKKEDKILPLEAAEKELVDSRELYNLMISDDIIEYHKERILTTLSENERELYRDYFENKLSYSEIAEKLGLNYNTAQRRILKLKKTLASKAHDLFCLGMGSTLALKLLIALWDGR